MRSFASLTDQELLGLLEEYVARERTSLSEFIACLSIVDQKHSVREAGYSSLFDYCTRKLLLSEDEACRRIQVARASIKHPEILSHLADGTLNLTTASRMAPHLGERAAELLSLAQNKTLREVEILVAPVVRGSPAPPRIVPVKRVVDSPGPLFDSITPAEPALSFKFSFEAPKELKELIDRSKDVLWHKYPFGQLDAILLEWGREWVARHDELAKPTPKPPATPADGDRPPAWVRNVVWKRDGGRCAYVAKDGARCQTRRGLELDHVIPRSLGGDHSPENTRLLCRAHNDEERRRVLGEGAPPDPPSGPQPGLFS